MLSTLWLWWPQVLTFVPKACPSMPLSSCLGRIWTNSHSFNSQGLKNIWTAETWCILDLVVMGSKCVKGRLCSGVKEGQGGLGRGKSERHPEFAKNRQGAPPPLCPQFTYGHLLWRHEEVSCPDSHGGDSVKTSVRTITLKSVSHSTKQGIIWVMVFGWPSHRVRSKGSIMFWAMSSGKNTQGLLTFTQS